MAGAFDYEAFTAQQRIGSGNTVAEIETKFGSTVYYTELSKPGPIASYVGHEFKGERTFLVWPYELHWEFCEWMVGRSYLEAGAIEIVGSGPRRILPQEYFMRSQTDSALGHAWEILRTEGVVPQQGEQTEYVGMTESAPAYIAAKVQVVYKKMPYRLVSDEDMPTRGGVYVSGSDGLVPDESTLKRFVTRAVSPGVRHLQFPSGNFTWETPAPVTGTTGTPATADKLPVTGLTLGRMIPFVDITYTWHQVPRIPKALFSSIGKVNATAFDEFFAGGLLLLGAEITPKRQVTGERAWDIQYRTRLMEDSDINSNKFTPPRRYGHTYFPRFPGGGKGRWYYDQPVIIDPVTSEKQYVFEECEFNDLFCGPWVYEKWSY